MPSQREPQPSGTGSLRCWASSVYGLGTICSRRDIKAHVSLQQTHKIQEIASAHAARTGSEGKAELPSEAPRDAGLLGGTVPVGTCAVPASTVPTVLGCSRCPRPPHTADLLQTQAQKNRRTSRNRQEPRTRSASHPLPLQQARNVALLLQRVRAGQKSAGAAPCLLWQEQSRPFRAQAGAGHSQERERWGRTAPPDPLNLPEKIHRLPSRPREAGTLPTSSSPGTPPRKSRGR